MQDLEYNFVKSKEKQENIMILLHGYGSDCNDLTNLAILFEKLKNTAFVIPNAPFVAEYAESGFQWFPLIFTENDIAIKSIESIINANDILNNFFNQVANKYSVPFNKIAIFGFSQGGIMALYNAIYSKNNYMAVISHSGLFCNYNNNINLNQNNINLNQNILIINGKDDEVIKFHHAEETVKTLNSFNIKYETFFKKNLGHHVDQDTINVTENFVLKHISK